MREYWVSGLESFVMDGANSLSLGEATQRGKAPHTLTMAVCWDRYLLTDASGGTTHSTGVSSRREEGAAVAGVVYALIAGGVASSHRTTRIRPLNTSLMHNRSSSIKHPKK